MPVSSKENDRVCTKMGGGTYHRWAGGGGGAKTVCGEGFMVCFPSPEFFTPFATLRARGNFKGYLLGGVNQGRLVFLCSPYFAVFGVPRYPDVGCPKTRT